MIGKSAAAGLHAPFWAWLVLGGVVAISLVVDLILHRGDKGCGRKAAVMWSVAWITVAIGFTCWIALQFGGGVANDFAAAYLVEKSLSIDNLFVFLLIFATLKIPEKEQHRVLFWGIFGALIARGLFIAAGAAMLHAWHGVLYVMGAFLLYTAFKTLRSSNNDDKEEKPGGKIIAFAQKHLRISTKTDGHRFIAVQNGRRFATPLLVALIVIELSDIAFAVDSIPAVFSVTRNPFIVYSSNVLAILGLRALYLIVAGLLKKLEYLRFGLSAILVFTGMKLLTHHVLHMPEWLSAAVIASILLFTVMASVIAQYQRRHHHAHP